LAHRVVIARPVLEATPVYVRQEARLRFEEIAEGLSAIHPGSAFWTSLRVSRLCLVVHGWSFFYTLEEQRLVVTDVQTG